jgi:hypothetical protein
MSLRGQMLVNDQSKPIIFLFRPFESIYLVHIYIETKLDFILG